MTHSWRTTRNRLDTAFALTGREWADKVTGKLGKSYPRRSVFCCPHRYVDRVLVHVLVQEEAKATLRCGLTAILQVMSNNACADGNSPKYPVIFVFPVRQISVGTEAVLIQTLAEKEEKQTSPWGVTTNFTSNGHPLLVQRPLIATERSYLTSCRQGT